MEAHIKKSVVPSKRADDGAQIFEEVTFSTNGTENGIPSFSSTPQVRRSAPDSFSQSPPKRFKAEDKPTNEVQLRNVILDWKRERINSLANSYNEHLLEHFFLDHDGNLMDMQNWLRNPSPELINHIKKQKLEGDQSLEARFVGNDPSFNFKVKDEHSSVQQNKSSLPPKVVKKYGTLGLKHKNVVHSDVIGSSLQQDQMVEKARQEAYIIQRISTLRKEGLWGEKKLPKVQEAARPKAHWDYLLEEMVWLSADFAQERKWKKAAAKKCAKMVQKYFQDKAVQAQKAEKEQEMKLRKIASFVAKEVRTFWSNVGKLIEFKVNARLDEKKKKALDQQLSFIVDQTEKYSSMLAESMKKPDSSNVVSTPTETQKDTSISDDEFQPEEPSDDDEATIAKEEDNPEEQASEVQLLQKESEQTLEDILNDLPADYFENRENSDMECEDENESVPESKEIASTSTTKESVKEQEIGKKETNDGDDDFEMKGESEDDEETIEKQEQEEKDINHKQELEDLEAENAMSVEDIRKKYEALASSSAPFKELGEEEEEEEEEDDDAKSDATMKSIDSDDEDEVLDGDDDDDEDEEDDEDNGSSEESSSVKKDVEEDEETLGIEDLIDQSFHDHEEEDASASVKERNEKVDKELQDASAVAESLQPKGFTLSSTSVTTPIPFLLKHTLREYQHVGLDWLVTMFEKKLNGILADEMGLGKTIQTIALLAHLACEKKIWGPHLIVVPTSVMLNWEMEFKKWCPAFKILTYYGTQKERKLKRQGWTKSNAFHVCITSYKLVIQDHQSFRRKKWRYFILDEAQNIKNFKSQRWQLLLNFQSQRRLLLTGTPLQNSLMELWSLMHFLMPNIFASHREFREWFSNPVTGMIEGNKEYNDSIIKRLHKVLRPFILRRLKSEVEQQMPKKYEHVVMCRLSKRQRFLYEEFMSRTKTKDTLASGNFLSVINILMQLRKVCNHPNLFEPRPTVSPFMMSALLYDAPSLVYGITSYDPFKHVDLFSLNLLLSELEVCLTAFAAHRIRRFQAPQKLIQEIDSLAEPPPKCPAGKIKLHVRPSSQPIPRPGISTLLGNQRAAAPSVVTLKPVTTSTTTTPTVSASNSFQTSSQWQSGVRFQLVQHGGSYKAIPLPPGSTGGMLVQQTPQGPRLIMPQRTVQPSTAATSQINTSTTSTSSGTGSVGGLQLVQTSAGQYLLTSSPIQKTTNTSASSIGLSGNTAVALLQRLQGLKGLQGSVITTGAGGRPVLRLPTSSLRPNITLPTSNTSTVAANASTVASKPIPHNYGTNQQVTQAAKTPQNSANSSPIVSPAKIPQNKNQSNDSKEVEASSSKKKEEVSNKSIFYLSDLEEQRKHKRKEKLCFIASLNTRRCHACPIYGSDLMEAVSVLLGPIKDAALNEASFNGQGMVHCQNAPVTSIDQYWLQTECLSNLVKTPEKYLEELRDITDRFVFCVPAVVAPTPSIRVSHPHPSILWENTCKEFILKQELAKPLSPLHPIVNASVTQFPDPRLIQYDCGKLQTLDKLLRQLKNGSHRVLIFTQMTKMLDVFEVFLNFHGHLYLRLDGTTKVEQRQTLMERFNQDKRIFAFILSTRSGGIGINLTGADTAQDRCHRIGQTRDVHIYRLISEKTIEENILKKANQKRLLGDLAIEGGNFTTASLKKNEKENVKVGYLENALAAAEDETDVQAAKTAKAEADAELAEFDENIPLDEQDGEEISKAEQEVALLMKQLTPIEKYAMHFLEESDEGILAEAERLAAEIEQQKKEWEMGRLQALQDEEKRFNIEEEDDEDMLTYSSVDAHNQVKNQGGKKEGRCRGRPRGRSVKSLKKVRKIVSSNLSSDENSCDSDNYNDSSSVENKDSYSEASDEEDSIAKRVKASEYSTLSLGRGSKGDKESPRTRSRGPLKINLWTLDETPLPLSGRTKLPGNSRSPIPDTVVDFHLENDNNETLMVNGDVNGHKDNSGRNEELLCLDGRDDGEDGMLVCKSTNDVPSILTSLSLPNGAFIAHFKKFKLYILSLKCGYRTLRKM
ncbi:Helicase domino [Armadillidium nasatum]|uniref:Helicase domino n=1 Tax=Armadillidium nasatum TaxID=96803 RepID=A0A5N5SQV8_9CRUS|nr:Helicase domino [Armadillidium nasatum]